MWSFMDIKAGSWSAGMCLAGTLSALMVGVAVKIGDALVDEPERVYFVALTNLRERFGFCIVFPYNLGGFFANIV